MFRKFLDKGIVSAIDRAAAAQIPLASRYVSFVRGRHAAEASPQITQRLERHYLNTVTVSGVAVGLSAAVPGIGTLVGLAASVADTVFFVETSIVFTLAAAEVSGGTLRPQQAPLASAIILGEGGTSALGAAGRSAKQWDSVLASKIPGLSRVPDSPVKRFAVQFVIKRGALAFGKVLPAGIGAVIGGAGNRALAHAVIGNVRSTLGAGSEQTGVPGPHGAAAAPPVTAMGAPPEPKP